MQKITKGALAGGAAALLLIGGGSTLALWSDEETISGGDLTFGELALTPGTVETADFELRAGDSESYENTYVITAVGEGLEATPAIVEPAVPADGDADLTVTSEITFTPVDGQAGVLPTTITPEHNGGTITVTTTVALAEVDEDLNGSEIVAVTDGSVTLTQNPSVAE